jgi:hypothetical protein
MAAPDDTAISKYTLNSGQGTDFVAASGSTASGVLSGLAGPWYIERQTLDIYYARVPQQFGASTTVTLDSASTTNGSIEKTEIVYYAVATYDTQVSYQNFNSSGVQQPQQFTVNAASGDINGVTYGNINASTMGPMGSIITSQPFIRRTPYLGTSSQPLISKTMTGSNWAAVRNAVTIPQGLGTTVAVDIETEDASPYMFDLGWHKDSGCMQGTARDGHGFNFGGGIPLSFRATPAYVIVGAYDTSKESLAQIQAFIDDVGIRITNENLHAWPVANKQAIPGLPSLPAFDTGFVEYDVNRHA